MVEYIIIRSYERVIFPHINNVETNLSFWLQEDIDAQISEVFIGRIKINFYVTYSCFLNKTYFNENKQNTFNHMI